MKKKITLLLTLMVSAGVLFAQQIKRIDGSILSADSLRQKITYLMKAANVTGAAVSVFNDNKPVFSQTFGLADVRQNKPLEPSSEMYGASLSKMVFAYIVMQLVQERKLDLDRPLVTYLDSSLVEYKRKERRGYQDLKGDERYKKITARMCLSHAAGFPNWRWFEPDRKLRIKTDPGTKYSYSGEGIQLLQFVIEKITGEGYETLSRERVFKPLHMDSTSQVWQGRFDNDICYGYNAKWEPYPLSKRSDPGAAGSMTTTPADFVRFYTALISSEGLSKKSFREMTTKQISIHSKRQFGPLAGQDSTGNDAIGLGYGLGVGVFQTPYGRAFFKEGHDDGWGHYTVCYPDQKIAIIILTNSDNGESIFRDLLAYAIGDTFTPWEWESYTPYELKAVSNK